jgi:lipopolysaccharide transport system permease protein
VWIFVWRDFVATYKQTILGPLWHIVQPLLTAVVLTFVFGRIARLSTDGLPPFLFYFSGILLWNYFAACVSRTSGTFINNAHLFAKVYFPRLTVPLAGVISASLAFAIQFAVFLAILAQSALTDGRFGPNRLVAVFPVLLAMMAALGLSVGVLVAALTTRYRDLQQVVSFGVQLAMYATPVIYPVSSVREPYAFWIRLNPATAIVEYFRAAFLGRGTAEATLLITSAAIIIGLLVLAVVLFSRVEATSVDTV